MNSRGEILVTLRHPDKELCPNMWENTGGSALAGETVLQGAVRELREEIGLLVYERELVYLGSNTEPSAFVDSFVLRRDFEMSELTLQHDEVVDAKWVTPRELDAMIAEGLLAEPVVKRLATYRERFDQLLSGA